MARRFQVGSAADLAGVLPAVGPHLVGGLPDRSDGLARPRIGAAPDRTDPALFDAPERHHAAVDNYFVDEANPTPHEIIRWARSDADEPMQDFDIIVAEPEMLRTLLDLVGDPECPKRKYLLGSLYCLVGHSRLDDPRIAEAVLRALGSDDPWLRTWARRTQAVLSDPVSRNRDDWCGWQGYQTQPSDEDDQ